MSSYTGGTSSEVSQEQRAPSDTEGPIFSDLKVEFENAVCDTQGFATQCQENYDARFALWANQHSDGKKHRRNDREPEVIPWEGASDLRVFAIDNVINSKVAMYRMAFKKASLVAVPIDGNDLKRAKLVSNFMRWLVQTQMPDVDREVELLANYINEKGVGVMGQFWEVCQDKVLANVSLETLAQQFNLPDILEIIEDPDRASQLEAILAEFYGCSAAKASRMMRELQGKGSTTVATLGRRYSRPVLRAFTLDEEVFIPACTSDIESASSIFRVEYFSPAQLRGFAASDGWNPKWVEQAIQTSKGRVINIEQASQGTADGLRRSRLLAIQSDSSNSDRVGVVYCYQRLSDEDGVPGIYLTIFNPLIPEGEGHDGYAKHELLGYSHGSYPFTLFRREYLSRRLHDTRGVPESTKHLQNMIKAHRDGIIDAASISVLPPMMFPMGRPPSRWGPGAKVPERRTGEYHFADRVMPDLNTDKSQMVLRDELRDYCGFATPDGDPQFASLKNQNEVDKFLTQLSKSFRQIFKLYQQFGDKRVAFRVLNLQQEEPAIFEVGPNDEEYDFYLNWDVQSMDREVVSEKLESIARVVATGDKYGQVDYSEWLQIMLEAIDPAIAERILRPAAAGSEQAVKEEKDALTKISAGFDEDIMLGAPPQIGMQVIQQWAQAPDVQARLGGDEALRGRVEKRMKQYQHQMAQQENAKIGRYGA